jgi:hypothetical protein
MKVFAETNFLVELTLAQEEAPSCEEIISLSEAGVSELILPAFSVPEAYHALIGRHRQRVAFSNELDIQLGQFRRSTTFNAEPEFEAVQRQLATSTLEESARFVKYSNWLISNAKLIPLTLPVIELSREWQNRSGLDLPDSVVLASVISDLQESHDSDSCFVTRDQDLTLDPEIRDQLRSLRCEIKPTFAAGLSYIRARSAST